MNQSTKAVDLTEGGALNAFQIRVESMTEGDLLIQIDALDKDNRYDSVAQVISAKPSQPLTYDFNAFLTSTSDKHVDFTRIIGVQIEFQWRQGSTGSMALGPLETVTTSVAAK